MRKLIFFFKCLLVFLPVKDLISQNIDINTSACSMTLANNCNSFLTGAFCGSQTLMITSHGSPRVIAASPSNKQILFQAGISQTGLSQTEGLLLEYDFAPNITYTVKITHSGTTGAQGSLYPDLFIGFTNNPQYYNDGCGLGHLNSMNIYASVTARMSPPPALTTTFTFTPTVAVGFLWLISVPNSVATGSLYVHRIQILDHSIPGPPEECHDGPMTWFCDDQPNGPHWIGDYTFRYRNGIFLNCLLFREYSNDPFVRRNFVSKVIHLDPGSTADGQRGTAQVVAAEDPCTITVGRFAGPENADNVKSKLQTVSPSSRNNKPPDRIFEQKTIVYPNPASNKITIMVSDAKTIIKVEIIDFSGKSLPVPYNITGNRVEADISGLVNGTYSAAILTKSQTINHKFVVLK